MILKYMPTELLNAPHSVLTIIWPPSSAAGAPESFFILAGLVIRYCANMAVQWLTNILDICAVGPRSKDGAE